MRSRSFLPFVSLLAGSIAVALATVAGCSSNSGSPSPPAGGCDGAACADTGTGAETSGGNDAGAGADAFEAGPGEHDGAAPDALYGCATQGSFGWTCTASTTGPDPTDCTDPSYPDCFVGGQGAWCTKTCLQTSDCTSGAEDAGCVPSSCNTKGYCK